MTQKAKTPWGKIAFVVGLLVCVLAGAAVGVILGNEDDDSGGGVTQRVAALALDTRGLNDDALALSRSIEAAIEREELEGEAETLRARLALIEERAARIRARARWEAVGARTERVADAAGLRRAERGLAQIRSSVAVFDHRVVGKLNGVLAAPASTPEAASALGEATAVIERQGERMTKLSQGLSEADSAEAESTALASGSLEADEKLAGGFRAISAPSEEALEVEYELGGLTVAADEPPGPAGGSELRTTASGGVSVREPLDGQGEAGVPPLRIVLLWEESELPASVREDASLALEVEEEGEAEEGEVEEEEAEEEGAGAAVPDAEEETAACRYELEEDRYCALAELTFASAEGVEAETEGEAEAEAGTEAEAAGLTVAAGETARLGAAARAGVLRIGAGASADDVDAVAELLRAGRPALVQVVEDSTAGLLQPACEAGAAPSGSSAGGGEAAIASGATIAVLEGDGAPVFAAERARGEAPPPCLEADDR